MTTEPTGGARRIRMKSGASASEVLDAGSIPEPNTGCWLWLRAIGKLGYGITWVDGACHATHRLSFLTFNGPIPDGLYVLHSCDVRACVNPRHLHLGTHDENMQEMRKRGRANAPRGETHRSAKLTAADVLTIRAEATAGTKQADLMRAYAVSSSTICRIISGEMWK